jgi:hypothetical protein
VTFTLTELIAHLKELKAQHFYGTIEIALENGRIVQYKKLEKVKIDDREEVIRILDMST